VSPALIISIAALVVSVYGVAERRGAARRAERLRFAALIDDLNNLHLAHVQPTEHLRYDDVAYAVNATAELLAMQAFGMMRGLRGVMSPEFRTLGFALDRAGYPGEGEQTWRAAVVAARREGPTASLFAHRGLAYLLFGQGRLEEGRAEMEAALEAIGSADDIARVHQIKTLKYWANAERRASDAPQPPATLEQRADQVVAALGTEHARGQMRDFLANTGVDE
jgi:hypothetical protein